MYSNYIKKFLQKYIFIYRSAALGWRITALNSKKFVFKKQLSIEN